MKKMILVVGLIVMTSPTFAQKYVVDNQSGIILYPREQVETVGTAEEVYRGSKAWKWFLSLKNLEDLFMDIKDHAEGYKTIVDGHKYIRGRCLNDPTRDYFFYFIRLDNKDRANQVRYDKERGIHRPAHIYIELFPDQYVEYLMSVPKTPRWEKDAVMFKSTPLSFKEMINHIQRFTKSNGNYELE